MLLKSERGNMRVKILLTSFLLIFVSFTALSAWKYPNITSVQATSNSAIEITWRNGGKFDEDISGQVSYSVYRSELSAITTINISVLTSNYTAINSGTIYESTGTTTSFIDEDVTLGNTYYYAITAYDPTCSILPYVRSTGSDNVISLD